MKSVSFVLVCQFFVVFLCFTCGSPPPSCSLCSWAPEYYVIIKYVAPSCTVEWDKLIAVTQAVFFLLVDGSVCPGRPGAVAQFERMGGLLECVPPTPGTRKDASEEPAKGVCLQGLRCFFLDEATSSRQSTQTQGLMGTSPSSEKADVRSGRGHSINQCFGTAAGVL